MTVPVINAKLYGHILLYVICFQFLRFSEVNGFCQGACCNWHWPTSLLKLLWYDSPETFSVLHNNGETAARTCFFVVPAKSNVWRCYCRHPHHVLIVSVRVFQKLRSSVFQDNLIMTFEAAWLAHYVEVHYRYIFISIAWLCGSLTLLMNHDCILLL